ncbi:Double-stranded RNA-specific editase 1, partial [Armadillidium vulgare]
AFDIVLKILHNYKSSIVEYKVISQLGLPNDSTFTVRLELNGLHFEVPSRSKKHAKYLTAESTLRYLVQFRNENEMLEESDDSHSKTFKFSNTAGGQCFEGTGSIKKLSKTVAAKEALSKLFGLIIPSPMDLHYDPLTSHPNLHMPQNLADKIAKNGCEKLLSLTSEKPTLKT